MKSQTAQAIIKLCLGALCIAAVILSGIYIYGRSAVFFRIIVPLSVLATVLFCAVDGVRAAHLGRVFLVCDVLCILAVVLYITYFETGLSETFSDFDAIRSFIRGSGAWGYAIFIGLTIFQVVVLPIPEAVTILLGVAVYGPTVSFILSVVGTVIGAVITFFLGKVFGRRLCNWMFGVENTEKYARLLGEKGKLPFIIMLLFPAFPDDMLCTIAGITDMSYGYFILVVSLTRPVMIGLTAYLGSGIIPFEGRGIAIWVVIACVLFLLFMLATGIKHKIEKRAVYRSGKR
ncbi:MAG: TVP38/TMEM64 family protein [Clostridiales bacterium]|nr:TVP38/TMEM64 family protein [Clostridiales bacterium]